DRSEPFGQRYNETGQPWHRAWCEPQAAENGEHEGKGSHYLSEPLRGTGASLSADDERREVEHEMREHCTRNGAQALGNHIGTELDPWHLAASSEYQADRGIKMRARDRPQD